MKEKNKFFYTLITVVILPFFWIGFFLVPRLSELEGLQDEGEQYQVNLSSVMKQINNSEKLEKNVIDLNSEVLKMQNKLISSSSLNNIAELLNREFNKYNVKIIHISPAYNSISDLDKNTENGLFKRLPIELKLEAKFMDLVHLLENSDSMSFLMHPDHISIQTKDDDTLKINLGVSVFVATGEKL